MFLILLAFSLTATRLFIRNAEEYRGFLEQQVSQYVEGPVRIKKLRARMRGFYPELVMQDVTVFDTGKQRPLLKFDEIGLGPDIVWLITTGELSPRWISVVGARLTIRSGEKSGLTVVGLKATDDPPTWLFEDGHFELLQSDIVWQDKRYHNAGLHLSDVDITIINNDDHHKIGVSVNLPDYLGNELTLLMDYRGNLFLPDCCSGKMFVEGQGVHVEKLFAEQIYSGYEINTGFGSFKLWSDWESSKVQSVYGWIDLLDPTLINVGKTVNPSISLDALQGWFRWQRGSDGWQFDVNELNVNYAGNSWPTTRVAVKATTTDSGVLATLDAAVSHIRIENITQLLFKTDLLGEQQIDLNKISPKGEVRDFSLRYVGFPDSTVANACGTFNKFSVNSWDSYPGLNNFTGFVCADSSQGVLKLETERAELDLPSLFRQPLDLQSLSGGISWERQAEGWRISTERVHVLTPDLDALTRFQWVSAGKDISPLLDLRIEFGAENAGNTHRYIPGRVMDKSLAGWLYTAFAAGTVENGDLLFYGPVEEFPFNKGQGIFQCRFDVNDMTLVYHSDWPEITDLSANVLFHNKEATIDASSGIISTAFIDKTVVKIPDIVDGEIVTVSGDVRGDVTGSFKFLSKSPLQSRINPLLQVASFKGKNDISLKMEIPLENSNRETKVQGVAKLSKSLINVDALDLNISNVRGHLSFTEDTLTMDDVHAVILGAPADIRLNTEADDFHLTIRSHVDVEMLEKKIPTSFWNYASGRSDYEISLIIPKQIKAGSLVTNMVIKSDLHGIEVLLPEPLKKPKSERKDFRMNIALEKSKKTPVELRYGEVIGAGLGFSEPESKNFGLEKGWIRIGNQIQAIRDEPGLNVFIQLHQLKLDPWWSLYDETVKQQENKAGLLNAVKLETGELFWGEQNYGSVSFDLQKQPTEWVANIENQYANGWLFVPLVWKDESFLTMTFDYLKLPDEEAVYTKTNQLSAVDLANLPNMKVKSAHLDWRGVNLGKTELRILKHQQGLTIDKFDLESDNYHLLLSGHWFGDDTDMWTDVQGQLDIKDLGRFLQELKFSEEVKETPSNIDFELKWNGTPFRISKDMLDGKVNLKLGKGRFLGVEPGIGRALGILNLDTWQRRLTLDFSDLYAEGMAYDKIECTLEIKNGNANTDDLFIDAVAAKIYGSGRIGLSAGDFDQLVTVVPKSSASLPIAGAIAGGPAVGAAIFLAQKLIGDEVDSIASTQYSMTGKWDDPQLTRLPGQGGMLDKAWTEIIDFTGLSTETEKKTETIE